MTFSKPIRITVNGRTVEAAVEPRQHLADFVRDELWLTGTHTGCEHGVCGACTIYLDGRPARSCITFAVACDGGDVRTIEGFDDDPVMGELREAFSSEHALQCGYCTPGMLVTARDIVLRLPDADEARIRLELSGNLCRCTDTWNRAGDREGARIQKANTGSLTPRPLPKGEGTLGVKMRAGHFHETRYAA
jgi:carbon-monoxide dehydrogenase small subunit